MLTGDLFAVANFLAANYCAERRAERERETASAYSLHRGCVQSVSVSSDWSIGADSMTY